MRYFLGVILAIVFFIASTAFAMGSIVFKQVITQGFVHEIIDSIPFETLKENIWNKNARPALVSLKVPAQMQEQIKIIALTELVPTENIKKQLKQNVNNIFTWLKSMAPINQLRIEVDSTATKQAVLQRIAPLAAGLGLPSQLTTSYTKTITQLPNSIDLMPYLQLDQKTTQQLLQARTIYRAGNMVVIIIGVILIIVVLLSILLFRKRLKIALRFLAVPLFFSALPLLFLGAALPRAKAFIPADISEKIWFGIRPAVLLNEQVMKVSAIVLWWAGIYLLLAVLLFGLSFAFKKQKEYTNEAQT